MEARQFFLEQYDFMRSIVDTMVLSGLSEAPLRHAPQPGQNSLAWLLWHTACWQDVAMAVLGGARPQVLHQEDWLRRMHLTRRDTGTGMTADECATFNAQIDIADLQAYWEAVGQRTREVARAFDPAVLDDLVDEAHLHQTFADGVIGSDRTRWLEAFFAGHRYAWWLGFVLWHTAEHLFGEALCVRSLAGIPLGF
jgi:hypothetical protein